MTKIEKIFIGTSGYNYKHWKGPFYPDDMSSDEWFDFYCQNFDAVEINNSFYQLPEKKTFQSWKDRSPDNFRFSVKASRYITHMKKLKDPKEPTGNFFKAVDGLDDKLEAVLFQLPPRWGFNKERLASFLKVLPADFKYAFEFRDNSWWNDETYELLQKNNAAFCIFDLEGTLTPKMVTSDMVYIRLHGPGRAYEGEYDIKKLSGWAGALSSWSNTGRMVHCYFDNDQDGYAAKDAEKLRKMVYKNR